MRTEPCPIGRIDVFKACLSRHFVAAHSLYAHFTMEHLVEIYKSLSSQLVTYALGRSQSKMTISTAIALVTFYMIYRSTQPPARLRHIPHVNFFTYIGAFISGKSLSYVAKNVILPVAMKSENGVYIVCPCTDPWLASLLLYGLCSSNCVCGLMMLRFHVAL